MSDDVPLIRVKSFAKIENVGSQNNEINHNNDESMEIISISSEEDKKPVTKGRRRKKEPKTPKPKKEKLPRLPASTGYNRRFKTPLKQQYHKISEYFSATKKDYKIGSTQVKPLSLNKVLENEENGIQNKSTEKTEIERLLSDKRRAVVLLRRLSIDKKVETKRTRDKHEDQLKLPEFIKYEPAGDSYYKTHQKSTLPEGTMVQINCALLRDENLVEPKQTELHNIGNVDNNELLLQPDETSSKGSIINNNTCAESDQTDSFQMTTKKIPSRKQSKIPLKSQTTNKSAGKTLKSKSKQIVKQKKTIVCPNYKIIEDTKFAVDAFRYGDIDGVEHYFLSHFHGDHYIGLKKSFNHTLYVSNITGRLVQEFIKVDAKYIKCIDINTAIIVDGVEITAVDANHCPGAVMFIFKLPSGKCILHTGDFRASPEMEEYPEFWNNDIHTIYLDTTYLTSRYEFQTQSDSINKLLAECHKFVDASVSSSGKPLIICGAYKVGKEKVWLRIAQEFDYKVWIDDERRKAMNCIQNKDILGVLTRYALDANIHVLPLGSVSYQHIVNYIEQFGETFCKVLAIRPSGWEKNAAMPSYKSRISMLGIQYSEHSNYNELERFIRFLRPEKVISTVPFSNKNVAKTPNIPKSWLNKEIKPQSGGQQRNIKDFLVKTNVGQNKRRQIENQQPAGSKKSMASLSVSSQKTEEQTIFESKSSDDFMM